MIKEKDNASFLRRLWNGDIFIYLTALLIFVLILLNHSPNVLRPISMLIRFGSTWILPLLFALLYLAFRLKGWFGKFISLTATISLFAFALAGAWASGHTQSTYISSLIPLYDAKEYYIDALRLLAGGRFLEFSAARPLFAGLLATLLAITNRNLLAAIIIFAAMNGVACYFSARTLQRTYGTAAAVFLLMLLFVYYRYRTLGTVMTESLGFALGVLGVTLIWRSIADNSQKLALFGLLVITLGLNARPGPFFILPAVLLWGSWYFRDADHFASWRFFVQGLLIIVIGFGLNAVIKQLIGVSSAVSFSQFSYALYGLASGGKSWAYIFEVHPELRAMPYPAVTQMAYKYAFDLIRQQPMLLFKGALHNWAALFSDSWYAMFSYTRTENSWLDLLIRWFLYLLCLLGLIKWIRKPTDPYSSFIIFGMAGVFASVPFVPPTDAYGMRLYAAGILFSIALPTLGLVFILEKLRVNDTAEVSIPNSKLITGFTAALLLAVLVGPLLVRGISSLPAIKATSCLPDKIAIVTYFDKGTYINILREKDPGLDWMPTFHYGIFRRNAHSLPDTSLIQKLESIKPLNTLFYTLDYQSNKSALVVIPTNMLPADGSVVEICGQWESDSKLKDYSFFIAESATVIPQQ